MSRRRTSILELIPRVQRLVEERRQHVLSPPNPTTRSRSFADTHSRGASLHTAGHVLLDLGLRASQCFRRAARARSKGQELATPGARGGARTHKKSWPSSLSTSYEVLESLPCDLSTSANAASLDTVARGKESASKASKAQGLCRCSAWMLQVQAVKMLDAHD